MFSRVLLTSFLITLLFNGYTHAATPRVSIKASLPASKPHCPFLDERVTVTYTDDDSVGKAAVLTIACAAAGAQQKTTRFTSQPVTIVKKTQQPPPSDPEKPKDPPPCEGAACPTITTNNEAYARFTVNVSADISSAAVGDHCTATVAISDNANRSASGDFKIGFKRIGNHGDVGKPAARVIDPITVGQEFQIGDLFVFNVGIPFWDLLLRECTATEDPWVFRFHNNKMKRVYPVSINSPETFGKPDDINPNNDNECLGRYDGVLSGLFTLGSDYTGCKLKWVKEALTGGDSFTAMGAPQLASASVTANAGKIWLSTGAKPTAPAGISNTILVYISTNRGQTWAASILASWSATAFNTDVDVSTSNPTDNTVNMALIGISDNADTKRWWRIVKGQ
ncbi:MAG: hypothetical protein OYH77_01835 [Pseudomonadota bacterium]|nr:hypothetical protein [Pseudomonadota bacterium]